MPVVFLCLAFRCSVIRYCGVILVTMCLSLSGLCCLVTSSYILNSVEGGGRCVYRNVKEVFTLPLKFTYQLHSQQE